MCMTTETATKLTKEEKLAIKIAKAEAKTIDLLPLNEYDVFIVSFSGGKDSLACVLHLIELGVPRHKIQLWHQSVDGEIKGQDDIFMDWPVTEAYCRAVAAHLGVDIFFQWREGGFHKELTKQNETSAGVWFESQSGSRVFLPTGSKAKPNTRGKFPQKGADLNVRWCSPALKIDVFARALSNTDELDGKNILVLTGERGEESENRSTYASSELHRCHAPGGGKRKFKRLAHAWRPIHKWKETEVWSIIERAGIMPHPAYYLGFGRVSCRFCIFLDPNGWATGRAIAPDTFNRIATLEANAGTMITKGLSVIDQADRGKDTIDYDDPFVLRQLEISKGLEYDPEWIDVPEGQWRLPSGAYKRCGGPT